MSNEDVQELAALVARDPANATLLAAIRGSGKTNMMFAMLRAQFEREWRDRDALAAAFPITNLCECWPVEPEADLLAAMRATLNLVETACPWDSWNMAEWREHFERTKPLECLDEIPWITTERTALRFP